MPSRVLVTGGAGAVGAAVCKALKERGHFVRSLDRDPADHADESLTGDIAEPDAVRRAVDGIHTVVHLAATPNDAPFLEELLRPNVVGLFNVMDAARHAAPQPRVVLASSVQVVNAVRQATDRPITADDEGPTNHYALTKVWAERMGAMYARCYNMTVLAIRIGWFTRDRREAGRMADNPAAQDLYLSHVDAGRFFVRCVEAPLEPGSFHTLFAASRPAARHAFDLDTARRVIGYEPRDVFPEGLTFPYP